MDTVLTIQAGAQWRELTADDLRRLSSREATERAGRWAERSDAVSFASLAAAMPYGQDVTHVTFLAVDGYAASITLDQALREAIIVVPPEGQGKTGVRLVVGDAASTCLNVKAVQRVELSAGPGRHTVDPNPHTPARVPGWDA